MSQQIYVDRRVTLEQLRAFVMVSERGSFQQAGETLCRSSSAVTLSLQKLEDVLQCRLLHRKQGHVQGLTPDGTRFLPEAKEILSRLDDAVSIMRRPELEGELVLGIPGSISTHALHRAVSRCMALNQGLKIRVVEALSADLIGMLDHGLLDVAILQSCAINPQHADGGTVRHLKRERLHWIGRSEEPAAMDELPLVMFSEGCLSYRNAALQALDAAGRTYRFSFLSPSYESVRNAIKAGFGIGVLPENDVCEGCVVLDEAKNLPALGEVTTTLHARSASSVIEQFCDLVASMPEFCRFGDGGQGDSIPLRGSGRSPVNSCH